MKRTQEFIDQYLNERKSRISLFLGEHLDQKECLKIQKEHLVKDLIKNPVNVMWAMPYFSIRKALEISEKLGFEKAGTLLKKVPRSLKTSYQKEIEQLVMEELFEISALETRLREACDTDTARAVVNDIKLSISQYCEKQNELSDLIASGLIVLMAQFTFGDKTLDLFGIGSKIASKYAHKKAAQNFFLGESVGDIFYKYSPPAPNEKYIFLFTTMVLLFFALMTTVISVFSFPVQKRFGITEKQLNGLVESIHDRVLLTLVKDERKKAS